MKQKIIIINQKNQNEDQDFFLQMESVRIERMCEYMYRMRNENKSINSLYIFE